VHAWHSRRIWRWALLAAVLVFVTLVLLRQPLGDLLWKEPQMQRLLERAEAALAEGQLSRADGAGARELFEAALALDVDRAQAQAGLARTADAALSLARRRLAAGDLDGAATALTLARELQVPRKAADAVADALRDRRASVVGREALLLRASRALADGHLIGSEDAALPLYARLLALWPDDVPALEGREDALTDLLQQARAAAAQGQLELAGQRIQAARGFDAGHADLPATEAAVAQAIDARRAQAARQQRQGRLEAAAASYASLLAVSPDDGGAQQGREQVVLALLARSQRQGADFRMDQARADIALARRHGATPAQLQQAELRLQRSARALAALRATGQGSSAAALDSALDRLAAAEQAGRFISPPGDNAYDALRAAQAAAPADPRVREATRRLLPAIRSCYSDHLRQNRVQAAGTCLQAWQTLAPTDAGLPLARQRLAERWIAIGSERMGRGDLDYAGHAAEEARFWHPASSEVAQFQSRVQRALDAR